jgi:hypothetical protein
LNSGLHTHKAGALLLEPHLQSIFALIIFGDGVSRTIFPGWPLTTILQISASQIAGITGVSSWHQANQSCLKRYNDCRLWIKGSKLLKPSLKEECTGIDMETQTFYTLYFIFQVPILF